MIAFLLAGGGYLAWSLGLLAQWLPVSNMFMVPSVDEPALLAANAIYSPDLNAGQAAWDGY